MPIEKEKVSELVTRLHNRCDRLQLADKQAEEWQTKLADDLNTILWRARYYLEQDADETDIDFARAVLRVVGRVAEFEGIRRAK